MIRAWLALLIIVCPTVFAADNTFPVGVPVHTEAIFCFDLASAKVVADHQMNLRRIEVFTLLAEGKCAEGRGIAVYVREVYRNGAWAVWELSSTNRPPFYEATDWKPRKSGIGT